jgi:hypothetical protein
MQVQNVGNEQFVATQAGKQGRKETEGAKGLDTTQTTQGRLQVDTATISSKARELAARQLKKGEEQENQKSPTLQAYEEWLHPKSK